MQLELAGIFFKKYFLKTDVAGAYSFSITQRVYAPKQKSGTSMTDIGVPFTSSVASGICKCIGAIGKKWNSSIDYNTQSLFFTGYKILFSEK